MKKTTTEKRLLKLIEGTEDTLEVTAMDVSEDVIAPEDLRNLQYMRLFLENISASIAALQDLRAAVQDQIEEIE